MLVNEDADLLPFDVDVDDHSNLDTTVVKEKQCLASSLYLIKMRIWYQLGPGRGQSPTLACSSFFRSDCRFRSSALAPCAEALG